MRYYVKEDFLSLVAQHHTDRPAGRLFVTESQLPSFKEERFRHLEPVAIPWRISFKHNGLTPEPEFGAHNYCNQTHYQTLEGPDGRKHEEYIMRFSHEVKFTITPLDCASFKVHGEWPNFRRLWGDALVFQMYWKDMVIKHWR